MGECVLSLINREKMQITGVNNVASYDEAEIVRQNLLWQETKSL